jgi:hypothetical protein
LQNLGKKKEKNHHIQFHSMHSFYASNACLVFENRSIYFILKVCSQRLLVEAFDMKKKKKKRKKKPCLHVVIILFVYILYICLILHGHYLVCASIDISMDLEHVHHLQYIWVI